MSDYNYAKDFEHLGKRDPVPKGGYNYAKDFEHLRKRDPVPPEQEVPTSFSHYTKSLYERSPEVPLMPFDQGELKNDVPGAPVSLPSAPPPVIPSFTPPEVPLAPPQPNLYDRYNQLRSDVWNKVTPFIAPTSESQLSSLALQGVSPDPRMKLNPSQAKAMQRQRKILQGEIDKPDLIGYPEYLGRSLISPVLGVRALSKFGGEKVVEQADYNRLIKVANQFADKIEDPGKRKKVKNQILIIQ